MRFLSTFSTIVALFLITVVGFAKGKENMNTATASYFGPGLYGNHMACGGRLYSSTQGVAHKYLRCGTRVMVCLRRCIHVRVVDRGPWVSGRQFDLTAATARYVGLSGVQRIRWCIC